MSTIINYSFERPLEDRAVVSLIQNGEEVKRGNIYDVREVIETMLEEKIEIFVSLQEDFDPDELTYTLAVHSDAYEDCEEDEIEKFSNLDITDNSEETTPALFQLLAIEVKFLHYVEA